MTIVLYNDPPLSSATKPSVILIEASGVRALLYLVGKRVQSLDDKTDNNRNLFS